MGGFQLEEKITDDLRRFRWKALRLPDANPPTEQRVEMLGFDTEYSADGTLLTVGVATDKEAVALETGEKGWQKKVAPIVKKAKVLVGHSISGDMDHLVLLGLARDDWLRGKNVRDSFLLARMHNENGGKGAYGLETLLLSKFNTDGWKAETEKLIKKTGNAADWTPEQRIARCRLDAWATVVLAEYFEKELLNERGPGD